MNEVTNPAKTLQSIMKSLRAVEAQTVREAFEKLFEVHSSKPKFDVMRAQLLQLIVDTQELVHKLELPQESDSVYMAAIGRLTRVTSLDLSQAGWEQNKKDQIRPEDLDHLTTLSGFAGSKFSDKFLETETVEGIKEKLSEVEEALGDDDFASSEFKAFILSKIRDLREALDTYELFGDRIFRDQYMKTLGSMFIETPPVAAKDVEKASFSKFKKLMAEIATVLRLANSAGETALTLQKVAEKFLPDA